MSITTMLLAALSISLAAGAWLARRIGRPWRRRIVFAVAVLMLAASSFCTGYSWWYYHRARPTAVERQLAAGIVYRRLVLDEPRPAIVHVVTVDLEASGARLFVTPGDASGGMDVRARTTTAFVEEFDLELAVNGSFFSPWHATNALVYYPHVGDPVDVHGVAISDGVVVSTPEPGYPSLWSDGDGRLAIGTPGDGARQAVSGIHVFVEDGRPAGQLDPRKHPYEPHPRTAVGLDQSGRTLILVVVDGRQPNYSEGMTLPELAHVMVDHGAHRALNLDGGGSSTLAARGPGGRAVLLNCPVHGRIPPGIERPVANHLGIRVR